MTLPDLNRFMVKVGIPNDPKQKKKRASKQIEPVNEAEDDDIEEEENESNAANGVPIQERSGPKGVVNKSGKKNKSQGATRKRKRTQDIVDEVEDRDDEAEDERQQEEDPDAYNTDRAKILLLLRGYSNAFPEICGNILGDTPISDLSKSRAKTLLAEIRLQVCCANSIKISEAGAEMVLISLEMGLLGFTPVKCAGLSNLAKDPDFMNVVNEMMLETTNLVYTKPHYRLLLTILKNIYILHTVNTEAENEVQKGLTNATAVPNTQ